VDRQRAGRQGGFTLVELMIVLVVLGVLATQAVYNATTQQKLAKRTELTQGLAALRHAQHAYYLDHGRFAGSFDQLTFAIDGGQRISPTQYHGRLYTYTLAQPWGETSYYVVAVGQLDSDAFPDVHVLEAGRR
jgi:prepilin-type N-terminal cleavage/methylation domain-containing protein